MNTRGVQLDTGRFVGLWNMARVIGVVATVGLIAGLFVAPEPTLAWTWNLVIPLLPATFLISPAIWRNVCPLATLNELPDRWRAGSAVPGGLYATGAIAAIGLAILIPARRVLLNTNGDALAWAVIVLGVAALGLGAVFAARSGFCNSVCPVLPVERLYGQHPLVRIRGSRCASCTFCTPRGCIDLAGDKAMVQMLGRSRHSSKWLLKPTGAFAAAFPGLILGYFLSTDTVGLDASPFVMAIVLAMGSYAAVWTVAAVLRPRGAQAVASLAAVSFAIYYWFAAPGIADQLSLGSMARDGIRLTAGLLLLAWITRPRIWRRAAARAA